MENKPNKLQFKIDIVLTVIFIAMIFFFGIMTVATDYEGIYKKGTRMIDLEPYLEDPENYTQWDLLEARVKSLDGYLAGNLYKATELGYFNSSFQYALGKELVNTGASQMLTLESGHLFDLQNYVPMENKIEEIAGLKDSLNGEIPFLFVYEHPTIYSDEQMPEGYKVLDYSDEIAQEVVTLLNEKGVDFLDSREILPASGVPMEEYLMYTDQHWSTRASMIMAKEIAGKINEMTGANLDVSRLDIDQFETEVHEKLFLGKYGQRIGTLNVDPDDITVYWPKYDTNIKRHTVYLGTTYDLEGPFKDSVIRWKYLKRGKEGYNIQAYFDYGLTENSDIYHNEDGADCTILLLKDSYSASIGAFLSLVADEVVAMDMRRTGSSFEALVERYDPDIVITAYSMQMLRDDAYDFQ